VSEPSTAAGLERDEAIEIAYIVGLSQKCRLFCISEYNPAMEKFKTGTLVHDLFLFFLFGLAKGKQ